MQSLARIAALLYGWLDERLGISAVLMPIVAHPVPRSINFWYVFGSATLTAFVVQVVTGVALAFTYVPAPNSAYDSLQFITSGAALGSVVRGIHFFGASAMVILIAIHMARVFVMGAYKFPREVNWLSGVGLLFLTVGMAFTGQLLRWNQDAYWAVVVAAAQAARAPLIGQFLAQLIIAGQTVGGATLTRFYATHVFLLPALMFGLIGLHLYLIVRHGISEPPRSGQPVERQTYQARYQALLAREGVPFWPDIAWRDVLFALAVGAVVVLLAVYVGPPALGKLADPTDVQAQPRPDWYLLWYFALLALIPSGLEDIFIIGAPLLAVVVLLALPLVAPLGERSPRRRPWTWAVVGFSALSIALLIRVGDEAPWSPSFDPPPLPVAVTQNLAAVPAQGAALFHARSCHNCHAIAGTGGLRGPDLTFAGDRLSRAQLTTRILNGGANMPPFANVLTTEELGALIEFLDGRRKP